MATSLDFLKPDISEIRHQIRGIIDSYSHDWDIAAECTQNALDAIRLQQPTKGHVHVRVDCAKKHFELWDNGTGIDPDLLPRLLRPFASNKANEPTLVGQKGVGISFMIFSSNYFEIETHHESGSLKATITGANDWVYSDTSESLQLTVDSVEPASRGTRVLIKFPAVLDPALFDLSLEQLLFVLRTRTALGNAGFLWEDRFECDVALTHISKSGKVEEREFECEYMTPTNKLKNADILNIEEFESWIREVDRTDKQKRAKVKDKIIFDVGQEFRSGRTIRYWSCFVPTRSVWDKLSLIHGLVSQEELDIMKDGSSEINEDLFFGSGLYISTKGMPTGIRLNMTPKGSAGYVPNFFILIEDPELSFDIGRKSIPGRQAGMIRDIAYKAFRKYINSVRKYMSGEPEEDFSSWNKPKEFKEIYKLPDLNHLATRFSKRPHNQEATVAAIFYELLGAGHFDTIVPLISGYKNKYDLYADVDGRDSVIEFKYNLSGLLRDFSDERKLFDQIDIVVLWNITEADRELASRRSLDLVELESGSLSSGASKEYFHYRLDLGPVDPIFIICIEDLLDDLDDD